MNLGKDSKTTERRSLFVMLAWTHFFFYVWHRCCRRLSSHRGLKGKYNWPLTTEIDGQPSDGRERRRTDDSERPMVANGEGTISNCLRKTTLRTDVKRPQNGRYRRKTDTAGGGGANYGAPRCCASFIVLASVLSMFICFIIIIIVYYSK